MQGLLAAQLPGWSAVMEFAAGGDMFQRVKACGGLKEEDARWFFQQLIIGLDYCHKVPSSYCMLSQPSCSIKQRSALQVWPKEIVKEVYTIDSVSA